jgi:hypothetical protein
MDITNDDIYSIASTIEMDNEDYEDYEEEYYDDDDYYSDQSTVDENHDISEITEWINTYDEETTNNNYLKFVPRNYINISAQINNIFRNFLKRLNVGDSIRRTNNNEIQIKHKYKIFIVSFNAGQRRISWKVSTP